MDAVVFALQPIAFALLLLVARHALAALLWPRYAAAELHHASLPAAFRLRQPVPGGTFRFVRVILWWGALALLLNWPMVALIFALTGPLPPGLATAVMLSAVAGVMLMAGDRFLMRRWRDRAYKTAS